MTQQSHFSHFSCFSSFPLLSLFFPHNRLHSGWVRKGIFGEAFGIIVRIRRKKFQGGSTLQFVLYISGFLDRIVLILVWFERSLLPARVRWQSCHKRYKGCGSTRGCYRWFRGEWINSGLDNQLPIKQLESLTFPLSKTAKLPISDVSVQFSSLFYTIWGIYT